MSCGPPLTLMKRTTLPVLTVSAAGSKAALLVPSPVIFTSTTAAGVAASTVAAAGAGAAFAVATAALCESSPFFSPPQAATPNTTSVLSTVQRIADLLRRLRYELVNAFTIYPSPSKAGGLDPLRFSSLPTTLEPMPAPAFPQMRPEDLALRLDRRERVQQLDRVGKGALSYVLVSDGDAVLVDPARHLERYDELLTALGATPAAVVDTHMHADYLSGARAAAARWQVPYFLHPDDAGSPYDGTPGRLAYQPLSEGDTIAFGRATLRAQHVPGHTLGSVALIADDALALTGDFLFVQSVGRPDLGGQGAA